MKGFGEENVASAEYLSPRDGTGHGSHVASTAAGDHGVRVEVDGQRFGTTSGMAPAARLAVYKACWTAPDPTQDGCTTRIFRGSDIRGSSIPSRPGEGRVCRFPFPERPR